MDTNSPDYENHDDNPEEEREDPTRKVNQALAEYIHLTEKLSASDLGTYRLKDHVVGLVELGSYVMRDNNQGYRMVCHYRAVPSSLIETEYAGGHQLYSRKVESDFGFTKSGQCEFHHIDSPLSDTQANRMLGLLSDEERGLITRIKGDDSMRYLSLDTIPADRWYPFIFDVLDKLSDQANADKPGTTLNFRDFMAERGLGGQGPTLEN